MMRFAAIPLVILLFSGFASAPAAAQPYGKETRTCTTVTKTRAMKYYLVQIELNDSVERCDPLPKYRPFIREWVELRQVFWSERRQAIAIGKHADFLRGPDDDNRDAVHVVVVDEGRRSERVIVYEFTNPNQAGTTRELVIDRGDSYLAYYRFENVDDEPGLEIVRIDEVWETPTTDRRDPAEAAEDEPPEPEKRLSISVLRFNGTDYIDAPELAARVQP